jgi:large subunit ribosomal protein L22
VVATKTNEQPGTRAQVRHARFSASKAREVLDLIRGLPAGEAADVLQFTERGAGVAIAKVLAAAVANAEHNDELDGDTLYVSACYADEGPTLKRWRPRARGRATRIRKRTCHVTIIVSPMPPEMAAKLEARQASGATPTTRRSRRAQESRRARVARSRGKAAAAETEAEDVDTEVDAGGEPTDEMVDEALEAAEPTSDELTPDEATEAGDAESLEEDEPTEERGVGDAEEGVAEGDAPTEAEDDAEETK